MLRGTISTKALPLGSMAKQAYRRVPWPTSRSEGGMQQVPTTRHVRLLGVGVVVVVAVVSGIIIVAIGIIVVAVVISFVVAIFVAIAERR